MRRVVVTGLGVVTPLGPSLAATRAGVAASRGVVGDATLFDASPFSSRLAGEVRDLEPRLHFRLPKALKLCDRRTRFAVSAAVMALAHGRFPAGGGDRLGVAIGTSGSDLGADDLTAVLARGGESARAAEDTAAFGEAALAGLNPLWLLVHLPNMASAHAAIQVEARGPNTTVMTGRAAGLQAVVEGAEWIREGSADAVLAGGADAPVHPFAFAALEQAGLLSGASPFVPGEGAAVLLLEELDAAVARGAPLLAELAGHALGRHSAVEVAAIAPPAPAALLERLAGHLLAAHAPAALALALADGLERPVCASTSGPFGEACALLALPVPRTERNAA